MYLYHGVYVGQYSVIKCYVQCQSNKFRLFGKLSRWASTLTVTISVKKLALKELESMFCIVSISCFLYTSSKRSPCLCVHVAIQTCVV